MKITYDVLDVGDIDEVVNLARDEARNGGADQQLMPARFNASMLGDWMDHKGAMAFVANCIDPNKEEHPRIGGFVLGQLLHASRQVFINTLTVSRAYDVRRISRGLSKRLLQESRYYDCDEVVAIVDSMELPAKSALQSTGFTIARDGLYHRATKPLRPY